MYAGSRYRSEDVDSPYERFLDQFEWDGGDFLYRYDQTGPAYRVTADERDDFIAAFEREQRWYAWLLAAVVAVSIATFVWVGPDPATSSSRILPWIILLGGAWAIGWGTEKLGRHSMWEAPQHALADRVPAAPALSTVERQRVLFGRVSGRDWGWLSVMVGIYALLLLMNQSHDGGKHVFLWLLLFLIWAWRWAESTIQIVRKWRFTRADHAANNRT